MRKKVLALYYSQSGQLDAIIRDFCVPLADAGVEVEYVQVRLLNDFSFPWTSEGFFSVMPDCVEGAAAELAPFLIKANHYDLIILGYQAWFLSPSIPFNSIVAHPSVRGLLADTPVITITGARNMWVNAFLRVKEMLKQAGVFHVGTVALVDRHLNLLSIFTIFHWMLGGKKDRYLGLFPLPGVSDADISGAKNFGVIVLPFLQQDAWEGLQDALLKKKAVTLKYHLLFMESKAGVMFKIWARWIRTRKKKQAWLVAFKYYLLIALFLFAPIVYLIDLIIFKPFLSGHIKARKKSLLQLN